MSLTKQVYISYSWKEEREGKQKGAVEQFCQQLADLGVEVVRDTGSLKPGDKISVFMRSVGEAKFLCIILSESYVKSPNCMYELFIAWQRSRDNEKEFRQRVKVWVVPELRGLASAMKRDAYVEHWLAAMDQLEALASKRVNQRGLRYVGKGTHQEYLQVNEFAQHVDDMLHYFGDTLSVDSLEDYLKWIQTELGVVKEVKTAQAEKEAKPVWADRVWLDDYGRGAEVSVNGALFVFRWIPPGTFLMGSPEQENGHTAHEGPQHEVTITRGFWLGETPVTQAQWEAVMNGNPSRFKGSRLPVEQVSWEDCKAFGERVKELKKGLEVNFPTEAQWEYACRAGTTSAFNDNSECTEPEGLDPALDRLGWFRYNSDGRTHEVKGKKANAWGLHDMHGNVWEWCMDDVREYPSHGEIDPVGRLNGASRVVRGGSWDYFAWACRSASRGGLESVDRDDSLGFRLAAGQPVQE